MDINELNAWIKTDAGEAWLNDQKAGLLNKNSELLDKVAKGNAEMKTVNDSFQELESNLNNEREWIQRQVIDKELDRIVTFLPYARENAINHLKKTYSLTVQADGMDRKAVGKIVIDGEEKTMPLGDILGHWIKTDTQAKECIMNGNTGGGATGSAPVSVSRKPDISSMSGQTLAKMSDADFETLRNENLKH